MQRREFKRRLPIIRPLLGERAAPQAVPPICCSVLGVRENVNSLPLSSALTLENNHHAVILQHVARAQFHEAVGNGIDADDVGLPHLFQKA